MSHKLPLNLLKWLYHYVRTIIINDLIIIFLNFKNILKFFISIISLNFNYKKFFKAVLKQLKLDIYKKIKILIKIIKYIKNLNINYLKFNIFNRLDIIVTYKNQLKSIIKFIQFFIIYLIDKYYYNFNTLDFIIKYITNKNYSTFFQTCYKLQKYLKIEQFQFSLKEELWGLRSFFKPSLYKNYTSDENLDLIYSLSLV